MTDRNIVAALLLACCAIATAQPMKIPGLTKDQEIAALKAELAAAKQQSRQAQELASTIQQPAPRTERQETAIYHVRGIGEVVEYRSVLDPQVLCNYTWRASGATLSCVRR